MPTAFAAAARKGVFRVAGFAERGRFFVCIQETKGAGCRNWAWDRHFLSRSGYHCFYHDAEKKGGYSGVASLFTGALAALINGSLRHWTGRASTAKGRWLQVDVGNLSVISLYSSIRVPPLGRAPAVSSTGCMDTLKPRLQEMAAVWSATYVICGDWNIAHKGNRSEELEGQPRRTPAFCRRQRSWMDGGFRPGWLARCVSQGRSPAGRLHLVVESRARLGQQCRVADRLPRRQQRPARPGPLGRISTLTSVFFRPCTTDSGLCRLTVLQYRADRASES